MDPPGKEEVDLEAAALDFKDQVNPTGRNKIRNEHGKDRSENTPPGLRVDRTAIAEAVPVEDSVVVASANLQSSERIHQLERELELANTRRSTVKLLLYALCLVALLVAIGASVAIVVTRSGSEGSGDQPPVQRDGPPTTPLTIPTDPPAQPPTRLVTIGPTSTPTIPRPTTSPTNPVPTSSPTKSFVSSLNFDGSTSPSDTTKAEIEAASASIVELVTDQEADYISDIARQWRSLGYNAVVINQNSSPIAQGYDHTESYTHCCQFFGLVSTNYNLYVGLRDHPMMVKNRGVGGFNNWVFNFRTTDFWIRWGQVILFMPEWDFDAFGETQVQRDRSQFPGWFF